jgi:phosphate transport system substrate-binding protein
MKKIFFISFLLLFILGGCKKYEKSGGSSISLSGMGATFPSPLYKVIFLNYTNLTGNKVIANEHSSGAGIRALQDKVIDFAGTNAVLSEEKFAEFDSEVLAIPTCLGAVVITYNLPEISELKLTGEIVADIYLKNINYWDDIAIQSINPEVNLPHKPITTVHRANGSGTSFVLSDYLAQVSPEWKKEMGIGKSLNWKNGIAVGSSLKVAGAVVGTEGAIGYTSWEHTALFNLPTASIQNMQGDFISVSRESILAAADRDYPDGTHVMITNSPNENAYPISCFSWSLVYKNQAYANRDKQKFETLSSFLRYIIDPETQKIAAKLHYAPLPENVATKANELINSMEWQNKRKKSDEK